MKRMGLAVEERKDPIRKELLNGNLDQKTLKYLYIQNVIQCNLPFSLLPNHTFCTSLQFVNLIANELLLNSGSTIQVRVMSLYEKWQHWICLDFQKDPSSIHISFNYWTTPNAIGIFEIVGHFTDDERRLQTLLFAMVEVQGTHTGDQRDAWMFEVLDQYYIQDHLGYFVMNNTTSNDPMVTSISE